MSQALMTLALKSTLDKIVYEMSQAENINYLDLDSAAQFQATVLSEEPALTWALNSLDQDPMDPLYSLDFEVGPKTSVDPAQYISLDLSGKILAAFPPGSAIDLYDYSTPTPPTQKIGVLIITSASVLPVQNEAVTGYRMAHIRAKAIRLS